MSCTHYQTTDLQRGQLHLDFKYPHSYYTTNYTSTGRISNFEACGNSNPSFAGSAVQMGRIARTYESVRQWDSAISFEKMQMRLRFLEDGNAALHLRNQNLIAENRSLASRLEENAIKIESLYGDVSQLRDDLNNERVRLADLLEKQTKNDETCLEDKCTSSTNIAFTTDRGIQIWEACKDCRRELEGCQGGPLTVTITKSELELLEKDMRTLRDAVIAREEAWDKAMEREQNCRRQLARLTAETITSHHLCETRQDELRMITQTLTEKELEIKTIRKETLYLNKLITKLYRYQREVEEYTGGDVSFNISEKDQRRIDEIVRRVRGTKGKSKTKSKCTSDKYSGSNSSSRHGSPRESNNGKDQAGSSEDHRN